MYIEMSLLVFAVMGIVQITRDRFAKLPPAGRRLVRAVRRAGLDPTSIDVVGELVVVTVDCGVRFVITADRPPNVELAWTGTGEPSEGEMIGAWCSAVEVLAEFMPRTARPDFRRWVSRMFPLTVARGIATGAAEAQSEVGGRELVMQAVFTDGLGEVALQLGAVKTV